MLNRDAKFGMWIIMLATLAVTSCCALADPISDRLDSIEKRLAVVEAIVVPATTKPVTPPVVPPVTPPSRAVRADTEREVRAAVAAGAQLITTTGIDINESLDCRGATIELLPGGPGWKVAISLSGDATLSNVTLKTPPSRYNESGQRTGFNKALAAVGRNMTLRNVTFAPDSGFCIHLQQGKLTMEGVKASTFSEYFVFQDAGTFITAKACEVKGGSKAESVWRVVAANYLIEDSVLDNSAGGKAVLRGDSPGTMTEPGGVVRRTKFVGQVGVNPLTEDDGGQMCGIDRWRFAEGWLYQLPYTRKAETIAFARAMYLNGATANEIVRACADKFINPDEFAKVAKGKRNLSDADIKLTLDYRASEVNRHSRFLIEDCEIVGDIRLNARMTGTFRRTKITSTGNNTPISGNTQSTYPFPTDRVIIGGEQQPAPDVTFDQVEFKGASGIGLDLKLWPTLKFINGSKFNSTNLSGASLSRIYNGSALEVAGYTKIRTDGQLVYRTALGTERWAFVGEYHGPGGTAQNPAPWSARFREVDPVRLRAYARSIKEPIWILDIEHWETDPILHGQEASRKWVGRLAELCAAIKRERPDLLIGVYGILPASNYWVLANHAAAERKSFGDERQMPDAWWKDFADQSSQQFVDWQKGNDLIASILLPHVDLLCPSIYPEYPLDAPNQPPSGRGNLVRDADVVRLLVSESARIRSINYQPSTHNYQLILPFYWPFTTQDGIRPVEAARTKHTVAAAYAAGADGIIAWFDQRPREAVEETLKMLKEVQ